MEAPSNLRTSQRTAVKAPYTYHWLVLGGPAREEAGYIFKTVILHIRPKSGDDGHKLYAFPKSEIAQAMGRGLLKAQGSVVQTLGMEHGQS